MNLPFTERSKQGVIAVRQPTFPGLAVFSVAPALTLKESATDSVL